VTIESSNSIRRMSFCTLAGVAHAEIVGGEILGNWKAPLDFFYGLDNKGRSVCGDPLTRLKKVPLVGSRMLAEELVNWRNDAVSILRFIGRFGPYCTPEPGAEFRQSLQNWRESQARLRYLWWHRSLSRAIPSPPFADPKQAEEFERMHRTWEEQEVFKGKIPSLPGGGGGTFLVTQGEWFTFNSAVFVYVLSDLHKFLTVELNSFPAERMRVCTRPNCETPYFTARHLRQTYCSDLCAQWGQRQWKKRWWDAHGETWREKHGPKKSKGEKRGTRKTR